MSGRVQVRRFGEDGQPAGGPLTAEIPDDGELYLVVRATAAGIAIVRTDRDVFLLAEQRARLP